jgi:multiple sugar transport system substrate-binding protein
VEIEKNHTEKLIKGITWGHSRGFTPLMAAAQRFSELHPGTIITWDKRTLQHFADYPIEQLAKVYDLLIIDHPWVGTAAATGAVLPLDQHLPAGYLRDQAENSTGYSHQSYHYGGHQWALAIDAATPVASYRPDLLAKANVRPPETWEEVLAIARQGRLAVPAIPIDLLMNFYMFCIAHGSRPFQSEARVIDPATGEAALHTMHQLYSNIDKKFFHANPIAVAEYMTTTDDYWYCPFAYGYSNYSREGYTPNPITYTDLVYFSPTSPAAASPAANSSAADSPAAASPAANSIHPRIARLRSTLGGTGLAISASSKNQNEAIDFAQWLCSPAIQSTFYTEHGGQPGHREAWLSEKTNRLTGNYFYTALPTMDRSYTRPRYHGYLFFQDHGGDPIRDFLLGRKDALSALNTLENLYAQSLNKHTVNT